MKRENCPPKKGEEFKILTRGEMEQQINGAGNYAWEKSVDGHKDFFK